MQQTNIDSRFDFFVLAGDGAGKHAISQYLNLHPRIFSYRQNDIETAVKYPYQTAIKAVFGDLAVTGWVYSKLDSIIADNTVSTRIKESVKPSIFLQVVRDPVRMMISLYNQAMQRFLIGLGNKPMEPSDYFDQLMPGAFYYKAGSLISSHFSQRMIIDTTDITGAKAPATLNSIFQALKVETEGALFQHPALMVKQNDIFQTILRTLNMSFMLLGVSIPYRLQLASSLDFKTGFPERVPGGRALPRASVPDGKTDKITGWGQVAADIHDVPPDIRPLLHGQQLQIIVDEYAWVRLDPKIRELLKAQNLLAAHFQGDALAPVFNKIRRAMLSFTPLTLNDISRKVVDNVKAKIAGDIKELFREEPALRGKWDVCGDI